MKLTIIPSDKAVYKDNLCYLNLTWEGTPINVHALQWLDFSGSIEFNNGAQNEDITSLPDWANNAIAAWQIAYDEAHKPAPDPLPPTVEENKMTASGKLFQTDWTTIPDVSDPTKSNPYLSNTQDFVGYRNAVRQYAVYPIAGNIDWPMVPTAVWIKT
jgi:hypothetical protein